MRKQLNRAIFAGIFLSPDLTQIRAELNEPFASITPEAGETPATQVAVVEPLPRGSKENLLKPRADASQTPGQPWVARASGDD